MIRYTHPDYHFDRMIYRDGIEALWRGRHQGERRQLLIRGWLAEPTQSDIERFHHNDRIKKDLLNKMGEKTLSPSGNAFPTADTVTPDMGIIRQAEAYRAVVNRTNNEAAEAGWEESSRTGIDRSVAELAYAGQEISNRVETARTEFAREETSLRREGLFPHSSLAWHRGIPFLIYEDHGLLPLPLFRKKGEPLSVGDFFALSVPLVKTVTSLHQQGFLHRSLRPGNLFVSPRLDELSLTGFSRMVRFTRRGALRSDLVPSEAEWPYLAPEETGRINRPIDERSDLYSLGILFYELLVGQPPFLRETYGEYVYAHLTLSPPPPEEKNTAIPRQLGDLIRKLLAKEPAERYIGARGLLHDLVKMRRLWEREKEIPSFPLREEDRHLHFTLPGQIYGRDPEAARLEKLYQEAEKSGLKAVLIRGGAGIGKSSLVWSALKPLAVERGLYLEGKFDPYTEAPPYELILKALERIISKDRSPRAEEVARILRHLEEERSGAYKSHHSPQEHRQRMHSALLSLFTALCREWSPLLLFLDDLQWADKATLHFIEFLLRNGSNLPLLFIGTVRDREIEEDHPVRLLIEEGIKGNLPVESLHLSPLPQDEVNRLIAASLHAQEEEILPLAKELASLSGGNPLYIIQWLEGLEQQGALIYDETRKGWKISEAGLALLPLEGGILSLIERRLKSLPQILLDLLKFASCIGFTFECALLAEVKGLEEQRVEELFWEAVEEGLLQPLLDGASKTGKTSFTHGRFLHDRIRQAVYDLLTREEKASLHLSIGRIILDREEKAEDGDRLSAVPHLNIGRADIKDPQERLLLARLNLEAGQRAKRAAALEEGVRLLIVGRELLPPSRWEGNTRSLTMDLTLELAEADFLLDREEEGIRLIEEILAHRDGLADVQRVYQLLILSHTHKERYREATEAGLTGLSLLGMEIPRRPGRAFILRELIATKLLLKWRKAEDLLSRSPMREEKRLIMELFIYLNSPAFHQDANLVSLLMLKAMRYTLLHGKSDLTVLAFNNYALFLSAGLRDYRGGDRFCRLSIRLSEEMKDFSLMGRTLFVYGVFINHWLHPYRESVTYLRKAKEYTLQGGYFSLAAAITPFIAITILQSGSPLANVRSEAEGEIRFAQELQYPLGVDYLRFMLDNLRLLSQEGTKEKPPLPTWRNASSYLPFLYLYLMVSYLTGEVEEGLAAAEEGEKEIGKTLLFSYIPEIHYYHGLLIARKASAAKGRNLRRLRKKLRRIIRMLMKWSKGSRANFLHKAEILAAEERRLANDAETARKGYERAIEAAAASGILQDEAIANELAYRFHADRGERIASYYLQEARSLYRKWGALNHPLLRREVSPHPYANGSVGEEVSSPIHSSRDEAAKAAPSSEPSRDAFPSPYFDTGDVRKWDSLMGAKEGDPVDLNALLSASHALSEEVALTRLLPRMMEITMMNTASHKGALLLKEGDTWMTSAYAKVEQGGELTITLPNRALSASEMLPNRFITSVLAESETTFSLPLYIPEVAKEPITQEDPYFTGSAAHSLLLLPIRHRGKEIGLLYLENDLITAAYPKERIRFLMLLGTQGAISIETARLHARIEEEVRLRTDELKEAYLQLEKTHQSLIGMEEFRREILYNVSHDLRSPLAAIQGYLDYLLDIEKAAPSQKRVRDYLLRMKERLYSLTRLTDDLFNLIELEMREVSFQVREYEATELLRSIAENLSFTVERHNLLLTIRLPDREGRLLVDESRMGQVFTNLIENAIKYTPPEGSITLAAEWTTPDRLDAGQEITWIGERGRNTQELLLVSVTDTGTGIEPQEIPHLFKRFYRGKAPLRSGMASHGLGLSICREIIERHGGRIGVKSTPGKGSTFYFTLPLHSHS